MPSANRNRSVAAKTFTKKEKKKNLLFAIVHIDMSVRHQRYIESAWVISYQHIQLLIRKIQEFHYSVHVNEQEEDERERLLKRSLNKTLKRP